MTSDDPGFDAAYDWLIEQVDMELSCHMLHLYDDEGDRCGCQYEGQGLPR